MDCVHAVYLGLIRAAFVIHRQALLADERLHGLLAVMMGKETAPGGARQGLLSAVCDFHYVSRFLSLEPEQALV